jgi:hypothetical protein
MPRGDGGAGARAAASLQYCGEIVGSFFPVCSRCRRMEQTFLCPSEYDGERLLNCHSFTAYLLGLDTFTHSRHGMPHRSPSSAPLSCAPQLLTRRALVVGSRPSCQQRTQRSWQWNEKRWPTT